MDVLHLAAHGRHSLEDPLFAGLQLVDGPRFGDDIDQHLGRLVPHTSCDFDFLVFSQLNFPDRPLRLTDFVPIVAVGPRCAN